MDFESINALTNMTMFADTALRLCTRPKYGNVFDCPPSFSGMDSTSMMFQPAVADFNMPQNMNSCFAPGIDFNNSAFSFPPLPPSGMNFGALDMGAFNPFMFGNFDMNPFKLNMTPHKNFPPSKYKDLINKSAEKYGVDPALVNAVIKQESGFNPGVTSPKGAVGLMQLMPATAKDLGVTDSYDPAQNIEGGVKYLAQLLQRYKGDVTKAVAAYNGGMGNIEEKGIGFCEENRTYVKKVMANYNGYLAASKAAEEAAAKEKAAKAAKVTESQG